MRERRGYEAAARTKFGDPGRRDDARHLGETVLRSDTHGVSRDWLTWYFLVKEDGPRWPEGRFKAALFYAYGCGWIDFLGWAYVVDPGPALRGLRSPLLGEASPAACRRAAREAPARDGQAGIFDISHGTTHKTGTASSIGQ